MGWCLHFMLFHNENSPFGLAAVCGPTPSFEATAKSHQNSWNIGFAGGVERNNVVGIIVDVSLRWRIRKIRISRLGSLGISLQHCGIMLIGILVGGRTESSDCFEIFEECKKHPSGYEVKLNFDWVVKFNFGLKSRPWTLKTFRNLKRLQKVSMIK